LLPHDFGTHQSTRGTIEELFGAQYYEAFECNSENSENSEAYAILELPTDEDEESESNSDNQGTTSKLTEIPDKPSSNAQQTSTTAAISSEAHAAVKSCISTASVHSNMKANAPPKGSQRKVAPPMQPHPTLPKPPNPMPKPAQKERPLAPASPPDNAGAAASHNPEADNSEYVTDPIDLGAIPLEQAKYENGTPVAADYIHPDGSIRCGECGGLHDAKGAHFCPVENCSEILCAKCTIDHILQCMPVQQGTPLCKFFFHGRCRRGRDCVFSHDVQLRNDTLAANEEDPEYATCVTHKRRRKKVYIRQVMNEHGKITWKCDVDDPESSCLKHHRAQAAPSGDRTPATAPPPPKEDPRLRIPAPKAALKQPKRESLDRDKSTSQDNSMHHPQHADRSRTPPPIRGRSPSRHSPRDASKSARSAKRSPSGTKDDSSRSRSPTPKEKKALHQCRIKKKYGVQLETATPTCELGHVLSISRVLKAAQFVEPKCSDCTRRIRPSDVCTVCYRCDPLFMLCVQCTPIQ
jgi:hypothetical protein